MDKPVDKPVAIVLGAAVWPGGLPSPALRRRAEAAAALYLAGEVEAIVATGAVGRHPPSEARAIRDVVVALGVPEPAVILEEHSTSTLENLAHARVLLPEGARAILVSDAWHLPRARLTARRLGLDAGTAAASFEGSNPLRVARAALREAGALLWYLLRPMR
ncbi:MAG: YdcF family protein [Paracoccaceae bacterium]